MSNTDATHDRELNLPSVLGRRAPKRLVGTEPVLAAGAPTGWTVSQFWAWTMSGLLTNTLRGALAEFLVGIAIGAEVDGVRSDWTSYDLTSHDGVKVEVKSTAYLQAWGQRSLSLITFATPKTRGWDPDTGEVEVAQRRHADVYVFALLAHQDKDTANPLDVDQWKFYVLPTRDLDSRKRSQHSITLNSLAAMTEPVAWQELDAAIRAAYLEHTRVLPEAGQ